MPADTPLGRFIVDRWETLGIKQTEFAERIGKHSALVQMVRTGRRHMPLDELQLWAKALELTGEDVDRFTELAHLDHCPAFIQKRYEALRQAVQRGGGKSKVAEKVTPRPFSARRTQP